MYNMKEFNVRRVQHHVAEELDVLERGQKLGISRRAKMVAQIGPPEPESATLRWPASTGRLDRIETQMENGPPDLRGPGRAILMLYVDTGILTKWHLPQTDGNNALAIRDRFSPLALLTSLHRMDPTNAWHLEQPPGLQVLG